MPAAIPGAPGRARRLPGPLPLYPRRRVPGHQRRPVSLAEAAGAGLAQPVLRRRRRPVDLRLARRAGRQHPALRAGLPRRQGHPAGAQLPLDGTHSQRRVRLIGTTAAGSARRCSPTTRRRQGRADRRLGRRGGGALHLRVDRGIAQGRPSARRDRHPGARLVPDARDRGPLHHRRPAVSSSAARASTSARRSGRDRLSRGDAQPGQRSQVRAHRQRAKRGLGDTSQAHPRAGAPAGLPCSRPRARSSRPRS